MTSVTLDDSRAEEVLRELARATGEDMGSLVHSEARHLANACAKASPPKSRSKVARKIDAEVSAIFSDNYNPNIDEGKQGHDGNMKWIIAGPHYLYGLPAAHDFRGKSNITEDYRNFKAAGGKRIVAIGNRGKQKVYSLNRLMANRGAVTRLKRSLKDHIGRAKAAWAQSAQALGETNIPEWISRHFPTPKAVTFTKTYGVNPSVTIGSRAPGVSRISDLFSRKLKSRINSMKARTKLIISGYARDVAIGIRPTNHAQETQPEGE